jgi:probable pyridine nucleotide-disulfide oxidoreductase
MNYPETYDAIVIGGGKGGKTLAMYLGRQNYKVALVERDPLMIGGGCINASTSPGKLFATRRNRDPAQCDSRRNL